MKTNAEIARENDLFRKTSPFYATPGVMDSPHVATIMELVRLDENFTPDNDPHGEHDFGVVVCAGEKYFWKIDYYDSALEYGLDPREEDVTRVLTVMRADEY